MPPSLGFARQTKELCFIICHRNSSALYGIPPVSYLLRPTYNMLQKEALGGLHTLQWSSFLFFFTKLQPPFSFPSSLLAFLWDLLGSLIVGFSLSKHQRTIFNLAIIKLINLDSLRGTVSFFSLQKTTESLNLKPKSKKLKLCEILWNKRKANNPPSLTR